MGSGRWMTSRRGSRRRKRTSSVSRRLRYLFLSRDVTLLSISRVQVTRDMLTEAVALIPGFTSYFAFSRLKSGYSGVATFCRTAATPIQVHCWHCWNMFDENFRK